jgi:hypothetical protein
VAGAFVAVQMTTADWLVARSGLSCTVAFVVCT